MSEFVSTSLGDRVAYDLRGSGPGLVFVAGAGPFRAMDRGRPRRPSAWPPWA